MKYSLIGVAHVTFSKSFNISWFWKILFITEKAACLTNFIDLLSKSIIILYLSIHFRWKKCDQMNFSNCLTSSSVDTSPSSQVLKCHSWLWEQHEHFPNSFYRFWSRQFSKFKGNLPPTNLESSFNWKHPNWESSRGQKIWIF